MEKTISMATLAKDPEAVVSAVESGDARYRIEGRNAILVDGDYFARMEDWQVFAEFVVMYPDWRKELADAKREITVGATRDLHGVLRELGLEGSATRPSRRPAPRATTRRTKARGKNTASARTRPSARKTDR